MCQKIWTRVSHSLLIPKLTQYIQFVKSGQKILAGPSLLPSFGQNPKEQLLFSGNLPLILQSFKWKTLFVNRLFRGKFPLEYILSWWGLICYLVSELNFHNDRYLFRYTYLTDWLNVAKLLQSWWSNQGAWVEHKESDNHRASSDVQVIISKCSQI